MLKVVCLRALSRESPTKISAKMNKHQPPSSIATWFARSACPGTRARHESGGATKRVDDLPTLRAVGVAEDCHAIADGAMIGVRR